MNDFVKKYYRHLEPLESWWFTSLWEGQLCLLAYNIREEMPVNYCIISARSYHQKQGRLDEAPTDTQIGMLLHKMSPSLKKLRKKELDGSTVNYYSTGGLEALRKEWETYIGGSVNWNER